MATTTPGPASRRHFLPMILRAFPLPALLVALALIPWSLAVRAADGSLPGTAPLTLTGDLSAQMIAGIDRRLEGLGAETAAARASQWRPDFSSRAAYAQSVAPNRARLARMLGVVDARVAAPQLEYVSVGAADATVAETDRFTVYAVRWPVFDGVWGEGLLLRPKGEPVARVVVLPDADQTPEQIVGVAPGVSSPRHYARRLAENGCLVLVPVLVNRSDTLSGQPALNRLTNQPHREWIYRQSFALGRHIIGYEVQKVLAAVDWFAAAPTPAPIGVVGWGEGGLLALHAAALDPRIAATAVSGYFGPREAIAREPIYRNVFGLLTEFGDAEVARLIVPRVLVVEAAAAPEVAGPPAPRPGRAGAAPGRIATAAPAAVRAEVVRAQQLAGPYGSSITATAGEGPQGAFFSETTLERFLAAVTATTQPVRPAGAAPVERRTGFDPAARQERAVRELQRFSQSLVSGANGVREDFLWKKVPPTTPEAWRKGMEPYRAQFRDETIGYLPPGTGPLNPRARLILDRPTWTAHEVVLDVMPDVFAWGYFLLPKDLKPGERRPVVVTQHGLEGLPADLIDEDHAGRPYATYKAYAARLVERGFIVFVPHNPYRGEFRELQRKAHPLGKSLFAFITAQHERILDWLTTLPQVDPARIGFYGLSYGGSTAMRVPALIERYAVTICSGNFNEWVWKLVTTEWTGSYLFTKEYEMPEFNLGRTFGHAEMAALIAPRSFMVERGHDDGVGLDEWVGFEYAKVNRLYSRLGIAERTAIEYFRGPHTIHGVGSFAFLHRQLAWPEPGSR